MPASRLATLVCISCILGLLLSPAAVPASPTPLLVEAGQEPAAPRIDVLSSHADRLDVEFTLSGLVVEETVLNDTPFQSVSIPFGGFAGAGGHPEIPTFTRLVAIPDAAGVRVVAVVEEEEEIAGFTLPPAQGYADEPFLYDASAYSRVGYGAEPAAKAGPPAILRDLRVVPLTFQPVRYDPSAGTLLIATRIRVEVRFEGEDPTNAKRSDRERPLARSFHRLYEEMVINYEPPQGRGAPAPGSYVLICPDNATVVNILQPLVEWRKRQGYSVVLATLAETGSSRTQIKSWLQNAYDTWQTPPEFVVLVGDATTPYRVETWFETLSGYGGEGDHPYTTLEGGDILSDVHIGRLSFDDTNNLAMIVDKILTYETNPPLADAGWFKRATLVGDPSTSGLSCVQAMQVVKSRLRGAHGYTEIDTIFGGNFVTQMTTSLNKGQTVMGYRGYLNMSGWSNSNSYALQNGYEMAFWVILTCGTGSFASGTARSEGALRASPTTNTARGAIGAIGTATLGTHTRYNNAVFYGINYGLLWEEMFRLGEALTRGKMEMYIQYYQTEPSQVEIWSYWNNLMGDPATECWTGYPQAMSVSHPSEIPIGANSVPVSVELLGLPVPGAQVCLLKEGEVHDVGYTDSGGFVQIPIPLLSAGELEITVTRHNRMPYLASIPVASEPVYVGFAAHEIDDDSTGASDGNGDGVINPGETIELGIQLRNFGFLTAPAVTATLSSADPYVTVLAGEAAFGEIPGGATAWSEEDFVVQVASSCPHDRILRFSLDVASGGDEWHSIVDLPVVSADLVAAGETIYNGGANEILDPGETVQLGVKLRNDGGAAATGVTGTLISETSFVTVLDANGSWADIPPGGNVENSFDLFTVSADPGAYQGYLASFTLLLNFSGGWTDTTTVTTTIGTRSTNDPFGPDAYGYFAFDNTDTDYEDAPVYGWIEIDPNHGGAGTAIPLTDYGTWQDDSITIDLPFPFQYYGEVFSRTTVCSNGWISFPTTYLANYRNWYLPAAGGPDGIIACFWDDLYIPTGGGVYQWYDAANHRLVIQWSRVRNRPGSGQTCQLILYDPAHHSTNSGDGIIEMQYHTVANTDSGDNHATVGIESPDSGTGLTYTHANRYTLGAATLASGRAIRFLPRSELPSGSISGVVRNGSYGGVPIPGAEVTIEEIDRTYVSGENGTYGGTAPVGVYTVTASHPGFEPATVENVEISQGQPTILDFQLADNAGPILTTTTHESTDDTEGPYPIPVTIVEYSGLPVKSLFFKTYGQTFTEIPLESLGGDDYLAEIPGQETISQVQYYVLAEDGLGQASVDPPGAPEEVYSFFVAPLVDLFFDDMEADNGWTVGAPDDDATVGIWERADPVGTYAGDVMVQPEDDHTPDGTHCFVTDGRGGAQGDYDVDNGKTTLYSPIVDLSSYGTITLRYYRWFTNDTGNNPGEDFWDVSISDDGGQTWKTIEYTNVSDRSWRLVETGLEGLVEDFSQVQLRFVASDYGGGSIVEAAVDDVSYILTGVVDAPEGPAEPVVFSLMPGRPNPSQGGTTIAFSLAQPGEARLSLHDVQGRRVRTLVDGPRPAGPQAALWDGRDDRGAKVSSGIYFARLEANGRTQVRKMLRLE